MDPNQPLLDGIQKKDEDAEILESTRSNIVVKTTLNIGTPQQEEEEIEQVRLSVPVQVIQYLFMIKAALWFSLGVFGIVPAQLLTGAQDVALALFICAIVTAFIVLVALYFVKKYRDILLTGLALLALCLYTIVFTCAAYFQDIAPFQACTILFLQCISILVYSLYSSKYMNIWWISLIMMLCGCVVWTIGLVAFVSSQDWVMSGILFFGCVLLFPAYCGWFIGANDKRFHLQELEQVIVAFFTDFYAVPLRWSYVKYVKKEREEEELFVLVDDTRTAQLNAGLEVNI